MGRQKKEETREEYNARMNAYMKERYKKSMLWLRQYKLEKGCIDCGYNKHHAGLQVDHLIPRNGNPKGLMCKLAASGINQLKKELENCEIVCGTCHGVRTWSRSHPDDLGV